MFLCSPSIHVCREYFVLPHTYVLGIICSPLPHVWRELNKLVDTSTGISLQLYKPPQVWCCSKTFW